MSACGAVAPDDARQGEQPFSTLPAEPNHEQITADGLSFLRPEVVLALQAFNVETDVQYVLDAAKHFDNCNFTGGSASIQTDQASALLALNPNAPDDAKALLSFARALHTAQDFYSHSNWVELGATTLVDASLTAFPTLTPYAQIDSTGTVSVQGTPPAGTAVWRKRGKYPNNAVVYVRDGKTTSLGLISGTVDYEPGNFCPPQATMTHDELNKDRSDRHPAQYTVARDLAVKQTRHEWCRVLTMARAAYGDAGDKQMFKWVSDVGEASRCGAATDAALTMNATPSVTVGSVVTVDLTVTNNGAAMSYGSTVRVTLPTNLVPVVPSNCSIVSPTQLDCYVGGVAAGATATMSVTATAVLPGDATISGTLSSHVVDTESANNTASATTAIMLPL
jgi:hypothetical protein